MKKYNSVFHIKSRSELLVEKRDFSPSKDYVYLNSTTFHEIYETVGIDWKKSDHPRNRPIVKITKVGTKTSIYRRLMSGNNLGLKKNDILLDWEALSCLKEEDDGDSLNLEFRKSNALSFYFNHFEANVRCPFIMAIISVVIGVVSIVLSVIL